MIKKAFRALGCSKLPLILDRLSKLSFLNINLIKVIIKLNLCLNISVLIDLHMYYSETKVVIGGLAHVPILIFVVNFIKGKFESIASNVVEVKTEAPKLKVVEIKEEEVKAEEVKSEELNASEFKEEAE